MNPTDAALKGYFNQEAYISTVAYIPIPTSREVDTTLHCSLHKVSMRKCTYSTHQIKPIQMLS